MKLPEVTGEPVIVDGLVLDDDMCEGCTYNIDAECTCPDLYMAFETFMELGMCTCRSEVALLGPVPVCVRTGEF